MKQNPYVIKDFPFLPAPLDFETTCGTPELPALTLL